ncbi:unnamed protein product [Bemisia tabaci]|uniref:Pyrroline-5-carboxylate reductase catalytic N-terminal domain-containing protein n=1 Tax=Bemisia tabaci TaxID=7038 RepID=A0A9P0G3Y3_BEMTA|nr:unnamed protein product [Bemisia tabaci]
MAKLSDVTVGFFGAGNMAQAIGLGLIKSGALEPAQIIVFAPSERNFSPWKAANVETTHSISKLPPRLSPILLVLNAMSLVSRVSQ